MKKITRLVLTASLLVTLPLGAAAQQSGINTPARPGFRSPPVASGGQQASPSTDVISTGGTLKSSAGGNPTLSITSPLPIGSFGTVTITGTPGNMAVLGLSFGNGPTPLWFGIVELTFPLIDVIKWIFPGDGIIQIPFEVICNPALVGVQVYAQALDVDLMTTDILLSNSAMLEVVSEFRGAWEYDLFASGDVTMTGTDVEGRMAVGGTANLTNFSLAIALDGTGASGPFPSDNLVVGSDLTYTNGTVYNGNVVHGGTATLTSVNVVDGVVVPGAPLDFGLIETELVAISDSWEALPAIGTTVDFDPLSGTMDLTGTSGMLNIFQISGADLDQATGVFVNAPSSSTCILNVDGVITSLTLLGFGTGGVPSSQVAFNFHEAQSLVINGVGISASILAPLAHVDFDNGVVIGQIAAASLSGTGQINHALFDACVTSTD